MDFENEYYKSLEDKPVGQIITEAREKAGLSKNQLGELSGVSHTEISRIESGEREIPNPKTLRKISKYIGINYNDLMYAAGLGFQISPLNAYMKNYYNNLTGNELQSALVNTVGTRDDWKSLVEKLKNRLENEDYENDKEKEIIENTIEDTEYQIRTSEEIIKLLHSALKKERIENAKEEK